MPSIPDMIEVARPLIHEARVEAFRAGMIEGKAEHQKALAIAIAHAESLDDIRSWHEANEVLLEEFRV